MKNKSTKPSKCFSLIKRKILSLLVIVGFVFFTSSVLFAGKIREEPSQKVIKGVVTDVKKEPVVGATVQIKGTKKGVITDFDGAFTINASVGDVLIIKALGHKTKEVKITSTALLTIILQENAQALKEVVVTGYDKVSKKTFTGAATTIKAKDLKMDGVVDVSRMLEGKVAGVNIQNVSGTFGAAPKVTIRGSSSIFGNNTPLYVIDGVVQEDIVETNLDALTSGNAETLISSSIAGINASDIKKIDILKDASATSIYGARARNGVVVITTKRGRRGSPLRITYNLEETVRDIPSYSTYDILNSKESFSVFAELKAKGYLELPNVAQSRYGGIYTIAAQRLNTYVPATDSFLLKNTPEARNRFFQQYELANTDWFKVLFQQSLTQNHTLSFTGGGENNAFYASIGFFTDPGWTIADNVTRLTANLRNTFYLSDKFNVTLATVASIRKQKAPGTFTRQTDTYNGSISRDFDINPFSYALNTSRTLRPYDSQGSLEYYRNNWAPFNILQEINNNYIDLNLRDIRFQADASYKITRHITYNLSTATRYVNSVREHQIKRGSNVIGAYNANETTIVRDANLYLYKDPDDINSSPIPVFSKGGIYNKSDNYLTSYYVRNSFSYKNLFNEKHRLNILLGQELRYVNRNRNHFAGYGLQYGSGYTPFTDYRLLQKKISEGEDYFSIGKNRERTVAFFGKATYGYKDKYIFSITGRVDGSNKQGKSSSSRWLPTGTVSAKWNATDEDFLSDSKTISNLQFRTSYGLVATPGSATNALAIFRSQLTNRLLQGDRENILNIEELQNSNLTWEKQYELNIGMDLGLFNNRILITGDAYIRTIFDNIDFVRTSGIGGEFVKQGNNADVDTKGIELGLTTKNIIADDFSWTSQLNCSYYHQKITKILNRPIAFDLVDSNGGNLRGYPINSLFSFNFKGLSSQGLPTFALPASKDDGSEKHYETTGVNFQDSKNLADYLVYAGSVDPNISGGFTNTFTYKNFSLRILITGAGGNKIRLNPLFSNSYSDLDVFSKDFINRWELPGDEAETTIPVIASRRLNLENPNLSQAYNAYNYSTARVADGSFVRMKNIAIGYSFDKTLTDKLGIASLKLKLQGTNLFLLYSDDKLNGQDPEFYRSGGVALPIRRQYTFSLNIGM